MPNPRGTCFRGCGRSCRGHLPVVVTVSNSEILAATRTAPKTEFEVYRHVAAMEIWNDYPADPARAA